MFEAGGVLPLQTTPGYLETEEEIEVLAVLGCGVVELAAVLGIAVGGVIKLVIYLTIHGAIVFTDVAVIFLRAHGIHADCVIEILADLRQGRG